MADKPAHPPPAPVLPAPTASSKADTQTDAFAKFFKRVGTTAEQEEEKLEREREQERAREKKRQLEREREEARQKELELQRQKEQEEELRRQKEEEAERQAQLEREREEELERQREEQERERQRRREEEKEMEAAKEDEEGLEAQPEEKKAESAEQPKARERRERGDGEEVEIKSTTPFGFSLPPRGTITKKASGAEAEAPKAAAAPPPAPAPPPPESPAAAAAAPEAKKDAKEEDEDERVQEISALDHRFVGLVIGKEGQTIKSFKKTSGASIEIDQNLPEGMPRAVIYRGSRKQVTMAKKLVESLVQRAKEDEKAKAAQPLSTGQGILGRGPSGAEDLQKLVEEAKRDAGKADPASRDSNVPPWRWSKGEEGERPGPGERKPLGPPRRDMPWGARKEKEPEAAPAGSLTGSLTAALGAGMRPAWMKPKAAGDNSEDAGSTYQDKSIWNENKYSRSLFLQAKQKLLKKKAYEVPEAMMTMTTGPRPKHKPEKKEKEAGGDDGSKDHADGHDGVDADTVESKTTAADAEVDDAAKAKLQKSPKLTPSSLPEEYTIKPGDSKEILKLKKKLREIQKIEDAMAAKEPVDNTQAEKVSKKDSYLQELRELESIVHSSID